ncbi:unnamed protein product [Chrysodeixis includens]|uniref:Uncharacterized protein n=1 Tax=Chrysodeixis includens TaxID=689277 RepID=A0A9N8KTA4_CHRIL|nr:unnamed protein product [Chrysodeixis includens]
MKRTAYCCIIIIKQILRLDIFFYWWHNEIGRDTRVRLQVDVLKVIHYLVVRRSRGAELEVRIVLNLKRARPQSALTYLRAGPRCGARADCVCAYCYANIPLCA